MPKGYRNIDGTKLGFQKGNISLLGKHLSLETCRKLSTLRKGRKCSEETKRKIRLAQIGIPRKKHTLEAKRKISLSRMREKNMNWKGGSTSLVRTIKTLPEIYLWRKNVFERDNYVCQECFKMGCKLNAHHIKPFNILFKEFLQQYSQFSLIEDKETLIRLAITYQPFWDINNGQTLCEDCHKLTDSYKNKKIVCGQP